jgi:guanosine-3',5'-bis(diphosphate) 3'-pyrophosphohydrolase
MPNNRRLSVQWNSNAHIKEERFPIQLRIEVIDRVGVLKDILMRLSDRSINVIDARVKTSYGKPACIDLKVELESVNQLEITINQIRSMVDVLDIARTSIN